MREIFLDFETFSYADLRAVGSYRYAEHPSTEPLCYAIGVDDSEIMLCVPDEAGRLEFPRDAGDEEGEEIFIAHNIEFEKNILKRKYGVEIPLSAWRDTAAMAARMSLPRNLEELAEFFDLDITAKLDANTARKGDSVCRPRKPSKSNRDTRWTPQTKPEAFQALYARCRQDVELLRAIYRKLLPLEESERRIWQVTLDMNERGVKVDLASIPPARAVLQAEGEPLEAEFEILTGCKLKSYVKVAKTLGLADVRKSTVRKALRDPQTSPGVHRALSILQALSKSSVAKLDAMEARVHEDDRVRGSFLYAGAERTIRWSSSGVQFQNFKRGLGKDTEMAFEALHAGALELIFDGAKRPAPDPPLTPTATIAEMLRGFIIGPYLVADLAQIEARGVAWLAEDEPQLTLFRNKADPYCEMAGVIYGTKVTKKDTERRFMGKQAELSCGYGIGSGKFQYLLDEVHDVQISDEFAKQVVNAYRQRHPKIVALWKRLNDGFVYAVAKKSDRLRVTRNIYMGVIEHGGKRYAYLELPSGRKMYYADPELESSPRGPVVRFFGRDPIRKVWGYVRAYGGMLCGHATQSTAREIIAAAVLRLNDAGFPPVMLVHDEIVTEQDGTRSLERFKNLMGIAPEWATGLPIEVDAFETFRYRK